MNDGQHDHLYSSVKFLQVFSIIILIPVCIGMLIRYFAPKVYGENEQTITDFCSGISLVLIIIGAIAKERRPDYGIPDPGWFGNSHFLYL
jgi:BASS family bile acid:Na+ symporter